MKTRSTSGCVKNCYLLELGLFLMGIRPSFICSCKSKGSRKRINNERQKVHFFGIKLIYLTALHSSMCVTFKSRHTILNKAYKVL